jgi:hypothetical protein
MLKEIKEKLISKKELKTLKKVLYKPKEPKKSKKPFSKIFVKT